MRRAPHPKIKENEMAKKQAKNVMSNDEKTAILKHLNLDSKRKQSLSMTLTEDLIETLRELAEASDTSMSHVAEQLMHAALKSAARRG